MYGPTETCIDATAYRATGAEADGWLPIGRGLPGYRIHLLDAAMQPVAPGLSGEIHIGGPALARGYLGNAAQTAERFVADPFGRPGERLYRTGDLARRTEQGEIEFVGRIDGQVKIRGVRIELGEIDAVLRRQPEVASAAVVTRDLGGEPAIVAYVVPSAPGGEAFRPDALRAALSRVLPHARVSDAIVPVSALPMTPHGKLDGKALPDPAVPGDAAEVVPPRHRLDEGLRDVWRRVLGIEHLGIDDNFFRIGGHSLMALRVVAAAKATLDLDLPVGALFRRQTIRALADALGAGAPTAPSALVALNESGAGRPVFCIHPVGGSAFVYAGLGAALSAVRPVFGLQAAGLGLGEAPAPSLGAMAAAYLAEIRLCQPAGPYTLLGHSFGGLVAFEMARQLEAAGEAVERLVLLDTSSPSAEPGRISGADEARLVLAAERAGLGGPDTGFEDQTRRIKAVIANNIALSAGHIPARFDAPLVDVAARRGEADAGRADRWLASSRRPASLAAFS